MCLDFNATVRLIYRFIKGNCYNKLWISLNSLALSAFEFSSSKMSFQLFLYVWQKIFENMLTKRDVLGFIGQAGLAIRIG